MTVCVSILLLPRKFGSPPWLAVMAWPPTVSVDVVNVACPLLSSEAVPRVLAPSVKVTVPVAFHGCGKGHWLAECARIRCRGQRGGSGRGSDVLRERRAATGEQEWVCWHIGGNDGMAASSE